MESDTFYGDFILKLVWKLLEVSMGKHGESYYRQSVCQSHHKISIKTSLSILSPYYLHNFYILRRRNISPVLEKDSIILLSLVKSPVNLADMWKIDKRKEVLWDLLLVFWRIRWKFRRGNSVGSLIGLSNVITLGSVIVYNQYTGCPKKCP